MTLLKYRITWRQTNIIQPISREVFFGGPQMEMFSHFCEKSDAIFSLLTCLLKLFGFVYSKNTDLDRSPFAGNLLCVACGKNMYGRRKDLCVSVKSQNFF